MIVTLCNGCVCLSKTLTSAWPASCQAVHFFSSSVIAMLRRSRPQRTLSRASSSSAMPTDFLFSARGEQRGFVQKIRQFRAGITGRAARDDGQIHVRLQFHVLGVNLQNGFAPAHVRQIDRDLAVKTAGPQQRRIKHVRAVGRRDDDDAFLRVEAVHLDEQRIQGLFAFVVAAAQAVTARTSDGVNFINENQAGRRSCAPAQTCRARGWRRRRRTFPQNPNR